ncbi:MAG: SsrA-binding protein SmpB [Chloroflexi bacterium]|nr:SsrA-binding protein SmpB [Chloroflexota bacterium]
MAHERIRVVATNRNAKRDYQLGETYEAGIALQGTEIKSVRAGQVSLNDAFVLIDKNLEAWLVDAYIAPYERASRGNHDPRRKRKLLLHKKEILRLWNQVREKGMTIVPTRMYLKNGRAKVEIALAKGKKKYDKRRELARKEAEREIQRYLFRRR